MWPERLRLAPLSNGVVKATASSHKGLFARISCVLVASVPAHLWVIISNNRYLMCLAIYPDECLFLVTDVCAAAAFSPG